MATTKNIIELSENDVDKAFRRKQIYDAVFKKGIVDLSAISTLSKDLRNQLSQKFHILEVNEVVRKESIDGTVKFLFRLSDGKCVEAVFLIDKNNHVTFCISSQVGCRMGCVFCKTGTMGLIRNLSSVEILSEVLYLYHFMTTEKGLKDQLFNIVYMGRGEPLDNFDNVMESISLITNPTFFGLSPSRITISTCGLIDRIEPAMIRFPMLRFALSLNHSIQEEREKIMPIARKFSLDEIAARLKDLYAKFKNRFTLEYVLIKDVNMSKKEIDALQRFRHQAFHINLIPLNHSDDQVKRPEEKEISRFMQELEKRHFCVTRRYRRGADIDAACGELCYRENSNAQDFS